MTCAKNRANSGLDALFTIRGRQKTPGSNSEHLRDFPMHQWVGRVLPRVRSGRGGRPGPARRLPPFGTGTWILECSRIALLSIQKFLQKSTGSAGLFNQRGWPILRLTKRKLPSTSPPSRAGAGMKNAVGACFSPLLVKPKKEAASGAECRHGMRTDSVNR